MDFLWPFATASVGVVLLVLWQLDRKRVLTEMAETPSVAVVLKERIIRTKVGAYRQESHSYWWMVARQDLTEREETLEVNKDEYHLYSEGETFELHEYPGTSRLVHGKKLGGRVDNLRRSGLLFLAGGVIWWLTGVNN